MPDSTPHNTPETGNPRCRWCGRSLSISSSTAEDWQLDFCSYLCRDNYRRTQEAEDEEAAERTAGPLFTAIRPEVIVPALPSLTDFPARRPENDEERQALPDWQAAYRQVPLRLYNTPPGHLPTPAPTAPEDDPHDDYDAEDTTTCPDSASVYSLSTLTSEDAVSTGSLYTLGHQRFILIECFSAWLHLWS